MAKPAVALIVAGSGSTSEAEVFDLLEDAYPRNKFDEIGLVVPVDKDLFSDAVKHAVKWFEDDKGVIPIQTKGASLGGRAAARLGEGNQEVTGFSDILTSEEFQDWDEVHFLVAMPDDADDPDYDLYAEFVEVALEGGLVVKDLTAGLDDVVLIDPDDQPEPVIEETKPEPVEEKPARRSRARKTPEPDPVVAEEVAKIEDNEETVTAKGPNEPPAVDPGIQLALETLSDVAVVLEKWDEVIAVFDGKDVTYRPLTLKVRRAFNALAESQSGGEPTVVPEEPESGSRGRGRPRTNFEVKQIWDENEGDDGDWVPRPKGRMRKGTQWRTIHAETEEVLEEGTA